MINFYQSRLPSGEGPIVCPSCGGEGFAIYGPDEDGKFSMTKLCFNCKFEEKIVEGGL